MIPNKDTDNCISLVIIHDLIKNTCYEEFNTIPVELRKGIYIITKTSNEEYIDYIKNIVRNKDVCPEAYWVKLADMKDRLEQKDTLMDKLKEKYLTALLYLL